MQEFHSIKDLPWQVGFGGVKKAEVEVTGGALWTVLHCKSGSYTMYGTRRNTVPGPCLEKLSESQVVGLLNFLRQ